METHSLLKPLLTALFGLASAVIENVTPMFILTTAFVAADTVTALRLQHRLVRAGKLPPDKAGFSSVRFRRVLFTVARILGLLILTAMADHLVLKPLGLEAMKIVAGAVCFWQAVSLLENEAAENDAPWAKHARRFLINKALRYISE